MTFCERLRKAPAAGDDLPRCVGEPSSACPLGCMSQSNSAAARGMRQGPPRMPRPKIKTSCSQFPEATNLRLVNGTRARGPATARLDS